MPEFKDNRGFKMKGFPQHKGVKASPAKSWLKSAGDYATSDEGVDTISQMPGMAGIGMIAKLAKGVKKKNKERRDKIAGEKKEENKGKLDMSAVTDNLKAAPTKKTETEETKETPEEKKARLKQEKKNSRKDWRKRTGGRIKDEAISIGSDALKGALSNALTPREKKVVNPTAGFNVQFGNK